LRRWERNFINDRIAVDIEEDETDVLASCTSQWHWKVWEDAKRTGLFTANDMVIGV
jgi:hypothetical protein